MSAERWWVEAQGRVWGPYPAERLLRFRDEGRLGPASRVGGSPDGPFTPAGVLPALAGLFEAAAAVVSAPQAEPSQPDASVADDAAAARTLLVITDGLEGELTAFEAALAPSGDTVRIRPGLWLLRSAEGVARLRNTLSRALPPRSMLLVVDAPAPGAAWFNLDGDTDRALRRLWSGS